MLLTKKIHKNHREDFIATIMEMVVDKNRGTIPLIILKCKFSEN